MNFLRLNSNTWIFCVCLLLCCKLASAQLVNVQSTDLQSTQPHLPSPITETHLGDGTNEHQQPPQVSSPPAAKPNPCLKSHKVLFADNDFRYLEKSGYNGCCLGDSLKRMEARAMQSEQTRCGRATSPSLPSRARYGAGAGRDKISKHRHRFST